MPLIFAQIELRGDVGPGDYESLDAHMVSLKWSATVAGDAENSFELPDGSYQQSFPAAPDMETLTNELLSGIEQNVWTDAVVLCMQTDLWWQSFTE